MSQILILDGPYKDMKLNFPKPMVVGEQFFLTVTAMMDTATKGDPIEVAASAIYVVEKAPSMGKPGTAIFRGLKPLGR